MSEVLLAYADVELGIHVKVGEPYDDDFTKTKVWPVESRTLLPGQYIDVDQLPDYLVKNARAGKVFGGKIVKSEEVRVALTDARAEVTEEVVAPPEPVEFAVRSTPVDLEADSESKE